MLAKRVFLASGLIGLLQILPMFFLENELTQRMPPALNHPEWYYGFAALCLPWQLVFLLISTDPVRYRPLMPLAVLEKVGFVVVMLVLWALGRSPWDLWPGVALDAVWMVLFTLTYVWTPRVSRF